MKIYFLQCYLKIFLSGSARHLCRYASLKRGGFPIRHYRPRFWASEFWNLVFRGVGALLVRAVVCVCILRALTRPSSLRFTPRNSGALRYTPSGASTPVETADRPTYWLITETDGGNTENRRQADQF